MKVYCCVYLKSARNLAANVHGTKHKNVARLFRSVPTHRELSHWHTKDLYPVLSTDGLMVKVRCIRPWNTQALATVWFNTISKELILITGCHTLHIEYSSLSKLSMLDINTKNISMILACTDSVWWQLLKLRSWGTEKNLSSNVFYLKLELLALCIYSNMIRNQFFRWRARKSHKWAVVK